MTEKHSGQGIDFNDIHCRHGLAEVRRQWDHFMENVVFFPRPPSNGAPLQEADIPPPFDGPPDSPAPSVGAEAREITLEDAKKRFALISGTTKVWDEHLHREMKGSAFKAEVGAEVFKQFMDASDKRKLLEQDVRANIAARQAAHKGAGGVGEMLKRFTYLDVSDTAWDARRRQVVRLADIRHSYPKVFDDWYRHPDRKQVDKENLVFDPTRRVDPETHINMFRGLPLTPERNDQACRFIRELLFTLCNEDFEVWQWITRWLAYPLQHVGAKMATAVLMHSSVHGSGKSLFFDGVMRKIYGEYSRTLGQLQMESQYTDWVSNLLYGLFEEIFSRSSKYSHQGQLKQMITGETVRVEKKFVSGWEEANHMNCVFLSNEIQPFPVEGHDRRFLVVWPEHKLPDSLQNGVAHELANGGAEAFYAWLLAVDTSGFGPHTKPPLTAAKERLIEFGRPSWEVFDRAWKEQETDAPYHSCLVGDLYEVYVKWCARWRMHHMSFPKFAEAMGTVNQKKSRVPYDRPAGFGEMAKKDVQGTFLIVTEHRPPEGKTQKEWLSDCVLNFRQAVFSSDVGGGDDS
ncbi:primase-helicase family protein [Microbulbifer sp. JSM ZJ756]|uniref:primase-helicase family protein n=1 Tax=Microbulbifer sp. JSM ZJ756 TaxID=3376191 RepID=UPI0037B65E5F